MKTSELENLRDAVRASRLSNAARLKQEELEVEACERMLSALKNYEEVFKVRVELVIVERPPVRSFGVDKKEANKSG